MIAALLTYAQSRDELSDMNGQNNLFRKLKFWMAKFVEIGFYSYFGSIFEKYRRNCYVEFRKALTFNFKQNGKIQ